MRQAVKFLLDRMDTHPEEFYEHRSMHAAHHWAGLINDHKKFFTKEEAEAIKSKLSDVNLDMLAQTITTKLLAPKESEYDPIDTGFGSAPIRAEGQRVTYAMQNRYQLDAQQMQLDAARIQAEHMKAHTEYLKAKGEL